LQDEQPVRSRRTIDKVILGVIVACLAIAVVRVTLAAVDVPYALYVAHRQTVAAEAAGVPAPNVSMRDRLAASWPFASWWGRRRPPYRGGGDYLKVVSNASAIRTFGVAVGVIARQLRTEGASINRVVFPTDRTRLFGRPPGTLFTRADGTTYRNSWRLPAQDAAFFSNIAAQTKTYDPLITVAQANALEKRAKFTESAQAVFVADPASGGFGTWIVLARDSVPRRFYVVPIELSPVGGGL
jgi:hypothetical protein